MKWQGRRGSRNIEDRRKMTASKAGGFGIIGTLLILGIGAYFNIDVTPLLQGGGQLTAGSGTGEITQEDQRAGQFVSVVLADTEEVWTEIFKQQVNGAYNPVTLVLFKNVTQSPCGNASGATGPFYCPGDQKVYLDTAFFVTLSRQLGADGDFAAAYVVAHEVAHHVQDELGTLGQANAQRHQMTTTDSNAVSVKIELQADCYSGIWANFAEKRLGTLEHGDIAEAINAAKQIGDDTLQRNAGQRPMPHTFTHGTSAQRQRWFNIGYQSGQLAQCDTFSSNNL